MNPVQTYRPPREARLAEWGGNVARCRKAHGYSQGKLAELCGVTQQTISGIERGENAPGDELKVKLADALHQDVRQLFPLMRSVA